MSRIARVLVFSFAILLSAGLVGSSLHVAAQDKKGKKKDAAKDKKTEEKKEEKIEKKEPFKPDPAQTEFKYEDKDKTFWVYAVAFSPDGKTVAASYKDHSVKIWDLDKKKDIQTIKGKALPDTKGLADFKSLVFIKNQLLVGTGHWNTKKKVREGEIIVFDAEGGKTGKPLKGHSQDVVELAVSKDGKYLASASEDKTVKIWDLAAGKDIQTLKGHTDTVIGVGFNPDAKRLVTTSRDKTVRVWDVADGKEIASFKVERDVEIKDAKGKVSKQKELGREFSSALFTNDGKTVIAGNLEGIVKIYDVEGMKEMKQLKAHNGILAMVLSPDGKKLATGGWENNIQIWDLADGKEIRTIKAHLGNVLTLSFSPNGQWLASGSTDGTIKIWSVK